MRWRAFVAFEMLWSIVIFGIIGVTCVSVALHFTRFLADSSTQKVLDSQIVLLRIQNLLSQSVDLHLNPHFVNFLLLDMERLLGYGDKGFANARFSNDTLLPQVPIEIFSVQGDEIIFSTFSDTRGFAPNQNLVLVCQSVADSEDFVESLFKVVSVGYDRLKLDSMPSPLCRAVLPLQEKRIEIAYHHDILWLNQEVLLENVREFDIWHSLDDKFVGFRFCVQQRCFEGGSFVGVKATFL